MYNIIKRYLPVVKNVFGWLTGRVSKSLETSSWLFWVWTPLLGTFIGNVTASELLKLEGMIGGTLEIGLNDFIASVTIADDVPDVIEGIDEEKVLVTQEMVEVIYDVEALLTTADGGIIENSGLVVAESVVFVVDQLLVEFEDIGKAKPGREFKDAKSVGSCGREGIVCSYNGFSEGGCSTLTGRDLNFILSMSMLRTTTSLKQFYASQVLNRILLNSNGSFKFWSIHNHLYFSL